MNKKILLMIALIVAILSVGAVSAGFFDFLHFEAVSGSEKRANSRGSNT